MAQSKSVFIKISVDNKQSTKGLNKSKSDIDALSNSVERLTGEQREAAVASEMEAQKRKLLQNEIKSEAAARLSLDKSINRNKTNAGLNNAIIAESARLASDASFGFTAIANNLGQLVQLFSASTNAAGGLVGAFRALISVQSLALIGIQLLITYGDKIYDFFTGGKTVIDEEREAIEKNTEALEKNIEKRELLTSKLLRTTRRAAKDLRDVFFTNIKDLELQELALQELSTRLSESGIKNAKIVQDETIALDARLLIAEKLIEIYNEEQKQKELRVKQDSVLLDLEVARNKQQNILNSTLKVDAETRNKALSESNKEVKGIQSQIKSFGSTILFSRKNVAELQEEIDELKKRGVVLTPEESEGGQKRFRRQFLNFTKEIEAAALSARKTTIERQEDLIRLQGEGEIKSLQERTIRFIEKQKERLDSELITKQQYLDSEKQAYEELEQAKLAINEKIGAKILDNNIKRSQKANELDLLTFRQNEKNELESSLISEQIQGKRARARIDLQDRVLSNEITSIQMRLDAGNLEVDERARLENELSKKQGEQAKVRMTIADAEANAKVQAFQVTADAMNAFSKLAGEDTKVGKALAVSGALISTYLSAQKAFESQFKPIATPDSPVRGAIAAAAAVASGLANVKAILSVNEKGTQSTGSATAAPITATAPQFNVVGTGATNQLAQAVGQQQQQPLKAFVVGSEVTKQQELDRKILNTAGI